MKGLSRRDWIKTTSLGSGLALLGGAGIVPSLTAAEIKKYNPRPLAGPIRLGSNENPYGPSESMRKAMTAAFDNGCRYPWGYNASLVKMIAEKEGVTPQTIINRYHQSFIETLHAMGITFDLFTQTYTTNHYAATTDIFEQLQNEDEKGVHQNMALYRHWFEAMHFVLFLQTLFQQGYLD